MFLHAWSQLVGATGSVTFRSSSEGFSFSDICVPLQLLLSRHKMDAGSNASLVAAGSTTPLLPQNPTFQAIVGVAVTAASAVGGVALGSAAVALAPVAVIAVPLTVGLVASGV